MQLSELEIDYLWETVQPGVKLKTSATIERMLGTFERLGIISRYIKPHKRRKLYYLFLSQHAKELLGGRY
jgi:hypothetical protein